LRPRIVACVRHDRPARGAAARAQRRATQGHAFLFERFYNFLNGLPSDPMGYLVFDELDRSATHILLGQVSSYFVNTRNGRSRSRRIIPEPFFVHSDLTTLIQTADIVAYVVSWGLRIRRMTAPARDELRPLVNLVHQLQFQRETEGAIGSTA
jgi:hypothetical protein